MHQWKDYTNADHLKGLKSEDAETRDEEGGSGRSLLRDERLKTEPNKEISWMCRLGALSFVFSVLHSAQCTRF